MIIDYKHQYSGHCESGTTSGLLRHYGLDISEPMAFGLGSGLYFSYLPFVKAQDAPLYAFRILPGRIFRNATRRLGVTTRMIRKFSDPDTAMKALDENLLKNIPTGVQVGTYHLMYFPEEYRLHYNFHNIVIFGRENGIYHVSEPMRQDTQLLAASDLRKARFARGLFGPKGRMYYVVDTSQRPDFKMGIEKAIRATAFSMTGQRFPFTGTAGIKKLSKDMARWPEKYSADRAGFYLLQLVRSIEEFGTGGAGYRYIYGAFLKEAGEIMPSSDLKKDALIMGEIATAWREFSLLSARLIKARGQSPDTFESLGNRLMEIGRREDQFFRKLSKFRAV